eukprot:Skav228560  [mRNA]  locus=scaffold4568:17605:29668:+ [translate_table: standard]
MLPPKTRKVLLLALDTGLGTVWLRPGARWYPVDPSNDLGTHGTHVRLRLLLHLRQGEGGDDSTVPESFERLCCQLLPSQEVAPSIQSQEAEPLAEVERPDVKLQPDAGRGVTLCQSMMSPKSPKSGAGSASEALRLQRAQLRTEAVELGKTCESPGDGCGAVEGLGLAAVMRDEEGMRPGH